MMAGLMQASVFFEMIESFADPQVRHAAMVHLPIAASALGALGVVALLVTAGRSRVLRWGCVALFAIGGVVGYMAEEAGEEAVDRLDTLAMTDEATELLERHEEMGERVPLMLLLIGGLVACTAIRFLPVRVLFLSLSLTASFAAAAYVAVTAHLGGAMVYAHGVGVPSSPNNISVEPKPSPMTGSEQPESDAD